MDIIITYILIGAIAGVIAGLLGIGGGLIIVPVLTLLFVHNGFDHTIVVHLAVGTSLATIIFTSISSMREHHKHGAIKWYVVKQLVPGIILGALLGAVIADFLQTQILKTVFVIYGITISLQMAFQLKPSGHQALPSAQTTSRIGLVIGSLSSIVGVGGGSLIVPYLVWCRVSMRQAIATSSACGFPIAVGGSLGFLVVGLNNTRLPDYAIGYIYWPALLGIVSASVLTAPFGAKLTHILPVKVLRRIFSVALLLLVLKMLVM